MSLFKKFDAKGNRRLKLLAFGDTGTGKTITALQMPNPAVIDTERGCEWYKDKFPDASFLQTSDPTEIRKAIKEVIEDPGDFKTLVIDSLSIFQEAIEERYLNKLRSKKGDPNYTFGPVDYKFIKSMTRSIIHDLLSVDMNVVCTAKAKPIYDQDEDSFIGKIIGYQPEVRKEVPYLFDVVIEMKVEDGDRVAVVHKDRTNTLPREITDFSYSKLAKLFGEEDLEREPIKLNTIKESDSRRNRNVEVEVSGRTVMTAGVKGDTLETLVALVKDMDKEELQEKLLEDYGQDSITSLREDEAQLLVKDLNGELDNDN